MKYGEFVSGLCKKNLNIKGRQAEIVHMILGISGEAGELLDAVKKHVIYEKPLDLDNVIEELGDLEFYLEGLRQLLGITREETVDKNVEKLQKRYPQGYTNQAAQERADKQEPGG